MDPPSNLAKAALQEVEWKGNQLREVSPKYEVRVQFNPETVSLSYSTQKSGGDQRGGAAIQYSGPGTTKLTMDLWFDVTALEGERVGKYNDVKKLTDQVIYFIKPKKTEGSDKNPQYVPPGVRIVWGKFLFAGVMDSLTEKLEFFSEDGRPLRAMLSIGITGQLIKLEAKEEDGQPGAAAATGTRPLQAAKAGEPLQQLTGKKGLAGDWKSIAEANGIENARRMTPGTLIDTARRAGGKAG